MVFTTGKGCMSHVKYIECFILISCGDLFTANALSVYDLFTPTIYHSQNKGHIKVGMLLSILLL